MSETYACAPDCRADSDAGLHSPECRRIELGEELELRAEDKPVVLPTGELVDLSSAESCAYALSRIREMESFIREAKGAVVDALAAEAKRRGENTFELEDGTKVAVKKNYETTWDTDQLENDLRAAGMPEYRIAEIIQEEVTHTVKAVEANKAAKASPEYAAAIERAKTQTEKRPTISLPRS